MIATDIIIPDRVIEIIQENYKEGTIAHKYYFTHCLKVAELAVKIANHNPHLNTDVDFLISGAMLHDIGIIKTSAPEIGCFGEFPYISHTYLGREMLEKKGMFDLALVCERHVGTGLSKEDIINSGFPLPHRDMIPITLEEKLICYADKFYSKSDKHLSVPRTPEKIRKKIGKYGGNKLEQFEAFVALFGIDYIYS
ncbi:MAG: HD domain-containing protein [Bacteroidetes bacterium]|nr:HD domain-containing protein [Bacteroidota bacterium]